MNQGNFEILGHYRPEIGGKSLLVFHACNRQPGGDLEFFLLQHETAARAIAKMATSQDPCWTGMGNNQVSQEAGHLIETLTGVIIKAQDTGNPFDNPGGRNEPEKGIDAFFIDGIKVEKANSRIAGEESVFYRLHIEPGWKPMLAYTRLPLNYQWEWWPVSPMTPGEFGDMVEMVTEFESGMYDQHRQLNDSLIELLKRLESAT